MESFGVPTIELIEKNQQLETENLILRSDLDQTQQEVSRLEGKVENYSRS